jgi:phosphate acetyltransferase/phosphate butyryltransferase
MERIENRTFDELKPGDTASLVRTLTYKDIEVFAILSGDVNPTHVDESFAKSDTFHNVVAHGMWSGALISAVLGTELPGPGTIYVDQSLHFHRPVRLGDTITVTVMVDLTGPYCTRRFERNCLGKELWSCRRRGSARIRL